MPKVSVIIPIYNSEKYLNNLIECINAQTYTDFEVIFVNDGSTDNSSDILQKYCQNNVNRILINKQNGGVSSARNVGMENANGEIFVFWDADDNISPDFLKEMVNNLENDTLIICGYEDIGLKIGNLKKFFTQEETVSFLHKNEVLLLQQKWLFNTLWNKIFCKSIIDKFNITFNEQSTFGEDAEFIARYIKGINKYKIINKILYTYVRRENNASAKYHENIYLNHKSMYEQILLSLDRGFDNYERCLKEIRSAYFVSCLSSLWHYCKFSKNKTNRLIKFALLDMSKNDNINMVKINPLLKIVLKLKWVWLTKLYYKLVLKGGK